MTDKKDKTLKDFQLRAKLPQYIRYAALGLAAVTVLAVAVGFYRSSGRQEFRMISFPTNLSKDVVAVVDAYERREMEGDVVKYYIKADRATSFTDNHQELENVYLEVFDPAGAVSDRITAAKAVYVPEDNKNFTGYFAGNVTIDTRDSLKVKTEQVTYKKATEIATAEELVHFERESVRGTAVGAVVSVAQKKLELLKDVHIETFGSPELASSNVKQASVKASYAVYDQLSETIEVRGQVQANVVANEGSSDITADRAVVHLIEKTQGGRDVKKLELHDNVTIVANRPGAGPTNITSGLAIYERDIDRFDLKNAVRIVTSAEGKPTNISSDSAVYEQTNRKIFLDGNGEVAQGSELLKGDHIYAELYPANKLKFSRIKGNAYLRQATSERTTEVHSSEMDAAFNDSQQLLHANAIGNGRAVLTPVNPVDYSKVTMTAPRAIRLAFKGEGLLDKMSTDGRTTIQLDVPGGAADAANKRVTADTVKTFFNAEGKDIQRAEAVGNAELIVEPLAASAENYRTTVTAPRFDCEFFPTGNSAKECVAATKTKTVRVPTVRAADRGDQTIVADKLVATFSGQTKDVDRLNAIGNAKFVELDRNAIASEITFTKGDETVRLRGGEPTVWDSRARARAGEIDWDTKNQKSYLRGGANTTYYSQKATGGATPFGSTDKPVFLTALSSEFDHRTEVARYSGNARAWQENNYVRADQLVIEQPQGQFLADGNVQSLLYNVRRKENGKESNAPVHVSAQKMTYNRDSRVVRYENNVDIRQGTDRILGSVANVYLDERNELSRSDVEGNVVITQPNRRAAGDFAQYIAADESVALRGNPARVEDPENGTSSGAQMTLYLRNNRVVSEGKSRQNTPGRIRSVFKVKSNLP
ncbi:MAG TPA: LPS export ABC transporter periplasmic protein LptC [Pyrinomonadaceae bacterium]|nr:LPS export ABC transporter periplasmic protein LptC [Pyrinomonadaceae bacterium]